MDKSISFCLCLVALMMLPAAAFAELDLAEDARIDVSSSPEMRRYGQIALRDNNPESEYRPATDEAVTIDLDLSPSGDSVELGIDRIEMDWGDSWPESYRIYAGTDRYSSTLIAAGSVSGSGISVINPDRSAINSRFLRIWLSKGNFALSRLSVFAAEAKEIVSLPALSLDRSKPLLSLSWSKAENVHHYEIERTNESDSTITRWNSYRVSSMDRPPKPGSYSYRLRAIDYLGRTSAWSDPVELTGYDPQIIDDIRHRGVVEGFYGQPWTHRQRLDVVRQMGNWGMNVFMYAPKNDSFHRDDWRLPYDAEAMARFGELLERGRNSGVDICFGISPGRDIDPVSDDDFEMLTDKLSAFIDIGYKSFALLLDDILVDKDGATGLLHVSLTNRLYDWLATRIDSPLLLLVPTVYSGTAGSMQEDQADYLRSMRQLHQDISIAWTGKDVFAKSITATDVRAIRELTEHSLWIWDNYPVNDVVGPNPELFLAPVEGRQADMLKETEGLFVNPMLEATSSLFAIHAYASLLADPESYDPSSIDAAEVGAAIDPDMSPEDWRSLVTFFSAHSYVFSERQPAAELREAFELYLIALDSHDSNEIKIAMEDSAGMLIEILRLSGRMRKNLANPIFLDETDLFFRKLSANAEAAMLALNITQAWSYGLDKSFANDEDLLAKMADNELSLSHVASDAAFEVLLDPVLKDDHSIVSSRFEGQTSYDPILADALEQVRAGQTWYYDAGFMIMPDSRWQVYADEGLHAEVDESGMVTVEADAAFAGSLSWLRLDVYQGEGMQVRAIPIEILAPLATTDSIDLPMTTRLESVDGVPVLYQNDVVVPDAYGCQYAKTFLSGTWKKHRMALDHGLTFSERSEETLLTLESESAGAVLPEFDDSGWDEIELPSAENATASAMHPSGEETFWGGVWYRKKVEVPSGGKDIRLVFTAAGYVVDVWADGRWLGHHEGSSAPAYFPLPSALSSKNRITLSIRVDTPKPGSIPGMFPNKADSEWQQYAGIPLDLYWQYLPEDKKAAFARVVAIPEIHTGRLRIQAIAKSLTGSAMTARIRVRAYQTDNSRDSYWEDEPFSSNIAKEVDIAGEEEVSIQIPAQGLAGSNFVPTIVGAQDWTPEHPRLYALRVQLLAENGELLDQVVTPLGFRTNAIDYEGKYNLNASVTFHNAAIRFDDHSSDGRMNDWSEILADLGRMKEMGATMLHSGPLPNHPATYAAADRLGLVTTVGLPMWSLDDIPDARSLELARQMWRETVFSHAGRTGIVMWDVCHGCKPSDAISSLILELHEELDANYPDGRLVTASVDAAGFGRNEKEFLSVVDLPGVTFTGSYDAEDITSALETVRNHFPDRSVMIAGYGAESELDASGYGDQIETASEMWEAVEPLAVRVSGGVSNPGGYVFGLTWQSMYDHYSLKDGVSTDGLFHMNRYTWKPVAELMEDQFAGGDNKRDDTVIRANKKNTGCSSTEGGVAAWFVFLLLAVSFRLRSCRSDPVQRK